MSMNANRMAELFQINLDNNLDNDHQDNSPSVTFTQKVEDVHSILKPDPIDECEDTKLITSAIRGKNPVTTVISGSEPDIDDDTEIPGDVLDEVQSDIQKFQDQIGNDDDANDTDDDTDDDDDDSVSENDNEPEPDITVLEKTVVKSVIPNATAVDKDNPLGLSGHDLKAYHAIIEKYGDKFTLYDGSLAYRDFYKSKVHALRHLLGQFPLLNLADMRKELLTIQTNHFIGDDVCTPDLIRVKLDSSQAHRTRLSSLLTMAFAQYHAWERFLDMARSKLWKDHDIKGAHKRDGMVMEHLSDMESYVASLKGFIDAAKQYDAMLKAAAESLSRQLTCLQLNEYTGTNRIEGHEPTKKSRPPIPHSTDLEGLDYVDFGTVISAPNPKPNEAVTAVSYGQEDEFSQLG